MMRPLDYSAERSLGGRNTCHSSPSFFPTSTAARRLLLLAASTITVLLADPVLAADWLGTTSSNWFTTGNWSPAVVPIASTDVTINNGGSPNVAVIGASGAVAHNVTLGGLAGQSGTLNVTGGTLSGVATLMVGDFGSGTVNISGGGTVGAGSVYLAADPGGIGTVTVSGTGSQLTSTVLYAGMDAAAIGQVTVEDHATLTSGSTVLGYFTSTARGTLTVTGATASTGALTIGERGVGVFNLNSGSTGTSGSVTIGSSATGNGTATISGVGTTWTTGGLNIGGTGAGALNISAGAKVATTQSNTSLAPLFLGGTATVTGSGSSWSITGNPTGLSQAVLAIGTKANTAATLLVADGGAAQVAATASGTNGNFQQIRLGISSGSTGALTVTGANSTFTTPYDIWAGYNSGTTGRITVSAGGALNTGFTLLGASGAGDAVVTGTGSVWTIADTPFVPGDYAQGLWISNGASSTGTLTIANGGTVKLDSTGHSIRLGGQAGSQGTLNIGAAPLSPAVAPGTLVANSVVFATGSTSTINFNHTATDYVFGIGIQGTGGTVNFLSGTTILAGASDSVTTYPNSYTGSTNVSAGATAQFGNGGATGLISGNIANNGAVAFNLSGFSSSYAGVISGSGTLEQRGVGSNTLTLTGTNTYSGLTKITSGTLQLGNGGATGSVAGDIENNSHLTFNRSSSFSFNQQISGTGDVTKSGSGVLTLGSAQSYTGGTSVQTGSLRLGAGNRLVSTGSMFLFSGGTFDLNGFSQTVGDLSGPGTVAIGTGSFTAGTSNNRTFAGRFTDSGTFTKAGAGTLTLTGDSSTYSGTTTVAAGTLAADGNLSASAVTVATGATLRGAGTVGDVAVASGGTLAGAQGQTLTTGDLTLSSGSMVQVALGAPANGTELFTVNGDLTLDGTLNATNAGGFGQGLYRLFDYTGSLTNNGLEVGSLPMHATGTVQTSIANRVNLVVDELPDFPFAFWDGTNTTANAVVDGGSGTWSATGTNWTNSFGDENGVYDPSALLIFAGTPGTVTVDGGVAGSLSLGAGLQFAGHGFVVQGDDLVLSEADTTLRVGDGTLPGAGYTAAIASNLTGAGGLDKTDLGTLILTGANSYEDGTTITAGTLRGSTASFGTGPILNDAAFIVDQATDGTLANVITGIGTFTKTGAGGLVLGADSSAFAGTTNVQSGLLSVNGKLGGTLNVLNAGRLQGSGTVGALLAASGATIAPGNSIGTLNVASISFDSGSVFEIEVNAGGQSDRIIAAGAATITGGKVNVLASAGSYAPATTYTILTADGGRTGTFTEGVTDNLAFLDSSLSYDAKNVYLTMTRNHVDFETIGVTPNQIATAEGLQSLDAANPLVGAVTSLSAPAAQAAFDQLSGEVHASVDHALIETANLPRQTALDRIDAAFAAIEASRAEHAGNFWTRSYGTLGTLLSDGNAATFTTTTGGLLFGADGLVGDKSFAGGFVGMALAKTDIPDRGSNAELTSYQLGLYGGTEIGQLTLKAGVTGSLDQAAISRTPDLAGFGQTLSSTQTSLTGQLFGEIAYAFPLERGTVAPFLQLALSGNSGGAYAETGGGAALTGRAGPSVAVVATLGLRATTDFVLGDDMVVHAHATAGLQQQFGGAPTATHSFAGGAPFTVSSSAISGTSVIVEAGVSTSLTRDIDLDVYYAGQLSTTRQSHAFKATLSGRF